MTQRIALVTGANRSIDLETCRQLLKAGYRVILTSRDKRKVQEATRQLGGDSPTGGFFRDGERVAW
ncbi:MAG: SDR family NAD(P)-dependent oxidoreductase [Lewinellaceae bacterium]|nr:SDR family NAD(P)-dependent oxidoreductase [Lewinellaceae bacterium]